MSRSLLELLEVDSRLLEKEKPGYTIYCDMDGVLTDFDGRFEHFSGKSPKEYQANYGETRFWELITSAGELYWSKMNWMKGGKELWRFINRYDAIVLSAPSREESSRTGKQKWVKEHLGSNVKLLLEYASEKQKHANSKSILIDDRSKNLQEWKSAGGIAIECKNGNIQPVLEQLKKLGYE